MTRIQRLRKKLLAMNDASVFFQRTALCAEAYEKYQWAPHAIQTARIFQHVLANMSVVIDEDDLLVGRAAQIVPDEEQERFLQAHGRFNQTLGQWTLNERCQDVFASVLSPREIEAMAVYGTGPGGWRNGHTTPSWPTVVNVGFKEIKAKAAARLKQIKPDTVEAIRKVEFLQAVMICADAIVTLSRRYSEEAGRLAEATSNGGRKRELLKIESICDRAPEYPARTFHEALQAVWLTHFVLSTVCGARDYSPGRFDQYLLPFYERDIANSTMTKEDAQELIDCFYIKINENIGRGRKRSLCVNSVQYLTIGGVSSDGQPATNDLSFLCLNSIERLRLKQPTVIVRYHRGISPEFFHRACEVIKLGTGNPAIFNDETMIPALLSVGVNLKDARDYCPIGCANPNIPGKEGALNDHRLNLVKCLELALNDGVCQMTGRASGIRTGRVVDFQNFDDLLKAFYRHVDEQIAQWTKRNDLFDRICASHVCDPFLSSIVDGCITSATDCYAGGATYFHNPYQAAGLATVADALTTVKMLVFEENAMSLGELNEILRSNFAGREDLRRRLRTKYPKFGNDDGRADLIAREIAQRFCRFVMKRGTRWGNGRGNWPGIYSFGQNHIYMGRATAATADGRKAGDPISFNLSPTIGCALNGPTAVVKSVANLDFKLVSGGGAFDLKLDPTSIKDIAKLEELLRTYFELGGMHAQINVVDKATLLDAQANPVNYRDLLVRVTGYSGYFTALGKEEQDDIISRHEHEV